MQRAKHILAEHQLADAMRTGNVMQIEHACAEAETSGVVAATLEAARVRAAVLQQEVPAVLKEPLPPQAIKRLC